MELINETTDPHYKNVEVGFTRKRDGKIVNVKLIEVFKKLKSVDFINNEVVLDGEVMEADSFRSAYYEISMSVVLNAGSSISGTYSINGVTYDTSQIFQIEKNTKVVMTLIPPITNILETVKSEQDKMYVVKDDLGNVYEVKDGQIIVFMDQERTITISYDGAVA